jgi:hypothetical protein
LAIEAVDGPLAAGVLAGACANTLEANNVLAIRIAIFAFMGFYLVKVGCLGIERFGRDTEAIAVSLEHPE